MQSDLQPEDFSTLLSFHSLRQQRSGSQPAWILRACWPFFSEPKECSVYPADVWAYFNSTPERSASQASRKEQLLAHWRRAGRFPPLDSPQSTLRIALPTGTDAADKRLNMDLLSERAPMPADVSDEVAGMKRLLGEMLRAIRVSR